MSEAINDTDAVQFQFAGQDLPWLIEHWAEAKPDHPVLIWAPKSGEPKRWTYREFNEEVRSIAAGLQKRGVQLGDKVLIHAENCPEMVLAWYACTVVGAVGVTTNTRSVGAEISYFAEHTGCVGAITQPQFAKLISENAPGLGWIVVTDDNSGTPADPDQADPAHQADRGFDSFETLRGEASTVAAREPDPMLPAGIMFTSGTTSRPKAVVHTHANALWAGRVGPRNIDMTGDDTYLIYLPFFHVNAQSWSFWTALGVGGTIVMQPKFSASRFWKVILEHQVTHISLIPFVFKAIAAEPIPEHPLKVGVFGLVIPELEAWLKLRVVPAFGMTETVTHATHCDAWQNYPNLSMGKPTPGYECVIVNEETGQICQEGEIGELWIRGARGIQMFLEYYNNDEAMRESFTEDGWFKTGDRVKLGEAGNYFYCDRGKDALKVGSENVSAREVEDACRQVGGIADVAVVAKSHEMLDMVPVVFIIKSPEVEDEAALAEQIVEHCKTNLADFKVPRAVYFVEDFPRATLDKVAKNVLREMADAKPAVP